LLGEIGLAVKIIRKSAHELEIMRKAGNIVWITLNELEQAARPGVSTADLDALAERVIRSHGATPSFKGYRGYPASICASLNGQVVHGIPSPQTVLREGDLLSIDLGAFLKGFHADSARTVAIGDVSEGARRLMRITEEALWKGIAQVRLNVRVAEISRAIQQYVESHGYSVVRELTGHGVGRRLHEDPPVPNFISAAHPNPVLQEGMTLAVEPMVNAGAAEVDVAKDGWTISTRDGTLSAHSEHTVAVTRNGPDVLTLPRSIVKPLASGAVI
jgi:methionyl aminopeptidase